MRIVEASQDIALGTGEIVVDAQDVVAGGQQTLAEMRTKKACPARDQDSLAHDAP